jgi:hypothetical protein
VANGVVIERVKEESDSDNRMRVQSRRPATRWRLTIHGKRIVSEATLMEARAEAAYLLDKETTP